MYNNEFHRLCVILYVVFILEIFRMIVSEAQSELSKFAPVIRRNGIHTLCGIHAEQYPNVRNAITLNQIQNFCELYAT
jgi:hypothetical protein